MNENSKDLISLENNLAQDNEKSKNLISLGNNLTQDNENKIIFPTPAPSKLLSSSSTDIETFYDSSIKDAYLGIKAAIDVSFIENPNDAKLTALISTKNANFDSYLDKSGGYDWATMYWPSAYRVRAELQDSEASGTAIAEVSPKNEIRNWHVSETIGYTVGGSITVEGSAEGGGGSIGGSAEYSSSRTVDYTQNEYLTKVNQNTANTVEWEVVYDQNKDGYTRTSFHSIYGNQLFMKSRLYNTGDKNIVDDLPSLITNGFSPSFAFAIRAPKGISKSIVKFIFTRKQDVYQLKWDGIEWQGQNTLDWINQETVVNFELDWINHTITQI